VCLKKSGLRGKEAKMEALLQDIRYGARMLAKSPGFTVIALLTLALGIGANTAIFSVVNAVLLNPLPYSQPDHLVAMYQRTPDFPQSSISYPNFLDWRRQNHSFAEIAAFRQDDFNLTGMGEPERLKAEMVSADFFSLLGVQPVIGRNFREEEDEVGAAPVAVISGGFWKRKFGSKADAVGRSLTLNGTAYTIVGVIPASFSYHSGNFHTSDVYIPIGQWNDFTFRDRRVGMGMDAVGRLKPGVTLQQAKADMDLVAQNLAQAYPDVDKGIGVSLTPLKEDVVGEIRPYLLVLIAAVGFVLLIACVNVANLMLVRATSRSRELAIRTALGASRGRVLRQLLTESVLLALGGGLLGVVIAAAGTQAALKVLPEALPRAEEIGLDVHVLLFTLGISILTGILFGLAPAVKAVRTDLQETLKEGGRGASGARHRAQSVFVVVEMGLALVLLIGAGLLIRSLAVLWGVNPGFDPQNVLTFAVSYPTNMGSTPDSVRASLRQLHDTVASVPGVEGASVIGGAVPMAGDSDLGFWLEGQPKPQSAADMKTSLFYLVQPDYLRIMKIPLKRGRFLNWDDYEHSPPVIVIDEQFAKLYFGGQDPIGKRVNFEILGITAEVVGIVGHVKQWGLDRDSTNSIQAQFYFPISQVPDQFMPLIARGAGFTVRTQASPLAQVGAIRGALEKINSQIVMYETETMQKIIDDSLASRRFSMILLGVFAGLALILSAVGIYGVISYVVGQRGHEIGIRMALGAQSRDVMRMVLGEGARMAAVGICIGLVASLALTRLMTNVIFGVSAHDPVTYLGVALVLLLVAFAACYIPARRATRVDPMVALRYE
jgi:predicted permease